MIVAVPPPSPVITPDVPLTATMPVLLLQVPPVGEPVSVAVLPWHTVVVPVMPVGAEVTVIVVVATQPEGMV